MTHLWPRMSSHSPLRFLRFINQKLKYCNLKQAKQAENRQKSAKVACYKLQYFNFGLKNIQKLKSHSREDWSPFEAQFERTGTINNILFQIKMSAFSSFEMGTTFSCCPYHILKINVVRIFLWWNADNFRLSVFSKSYLYQHLENKCCPRFLFLKWGQHFHVVRINFWKKSCPQFHFMKCGQHF